MEATSQDTDTSIMFNRGLAEHNAGNLSAAEKVYQEILLIKPGHPEANHNIGIVLVTKNELDKALKFFKFALNSSPNVSLFWASYIDVLVKLERIIEAKALISASKNAGLFCSKIKSISQSLDDQCPKVGTKVSGQASEVKGNWGQWLPNIGCEQKEIVGIKSRDLGGIEKTSSAPEKASSVVATIKNFYKKRSVDIIIAAARGWVYTTNFDKNFISLSPSSSFGTNTRNSVPQEQRSQAALCELQLDPGQIITYLEQNDNLVDRFSNLKLLIKSNNIHLVNDSFAQDVDTDILAAQEKTFKTEGVNIAIIGAGATGLFLASIIKSAFADAVNVLILDNRSNKTNTREIFSRNWLTHIPVSIVQRFTPPNIKKLLACFGKNGLIGIPISALETILMLSCKDQGVKFYFSPNLDLSNLNNGSIDFFFDATGGKMTGSTYQSARGLNFPLRIEKTHSDLIPKDTNKFSDLPYYEPDYLQLMLKSSGHFYYPYVKNSKIHTHMFKLTGIPINLVEALREFVKPLNALNLFYIWEGTLRDEINEGLILVNLSSKEYETLTSCIHKPMNLNTFLKINSNILPILNQDIVSFFNVLIELDAYGQICIERPFTYSPYINLDPGCGQFNGKPIFPIGDSLFCGHPKVGNGLGEHLGLLNDLVLEMMTIGKLAR